MTHRYLCCVFVLCPFLIAPLTTSALYVVTVSRVTVVAVIGFTTTNEISAYRH